MLYSQTGECRVEIQRRPLSGHYVLIVYQRQPAPRNGPNVSLLGIIAASTQTKPIDYLFIVDFQENMPELGQQLCFPFPSKHWIFRSE